MSKLTELSLHGFKSIEEIKNLELRSLNILIGANGAGKSNFISFFNLVSRLIESELQYHIAQEGGSDHFLHYGGQVTPSLGAELYFDRGGYLFELEPAKGNRMLFAKEAFRSDTGHGPIKQSFGKGHEETQATNGAESPMASIAVALKRWRVFHFHDTSDTAKVKQSGALNDNAGLRPDAANLAAYLYRIGRTHATHYRLIVRTIRLIAPFFADFQLRPMPTSPNHIQLEWRSQGSDYPFRADHLSDGMLRFICLAALLLQPYQMTPTTILIDEPELGLHPIAIQLLADLIKATSRQRQLIVSTQSVELLNYFEADDVIVVDLQDGASRFRRLSNDELAGWLQEYSLGDAWKCNVLGGRPA